MSLIQAAEIVTHPTDRFAGGVAWTPEPLRGEGSGDIGVWKVDAANNPVTGYARSAPASGQPYGIWASEKSSAFGLDFAELQTRVQRKLLAYESMAIEAQLWSDGTGENSSMKLAQASASTVGSSAGQNVTDSLGYLDMAIATTWGRGMIHCRPTILSTAYGAQCIRVEGNTWLSPMGNIIIPGAGYAGTGPAGQAVTATSEWAYATPAVQVHRGAIFMTPENVREATNKTTNTVTIHAMRIALAMWDYSGGHFAAKIIRKDAGVA